MPNLGCPHTARFEILDQRNVGRGAAYIERQDILESGIFANPKRAGHPARWPRHQYVDRMLFGLFRRHQPTVGTEQRQLSRHSRYLQFVTQIADIIADHRTHCGIGNGGERAFIFLHFGQD